MNRTRRLVFIGSGILVVVSLIVIASSFDLSALPEPGAFEVSMATRAKRILVGRASRHDIPSEPAKSADGLMEGKMRYGVECAACHGMDGRGLTDNGRWMYPRAADLTSSAVHEYSDQELFWIIKNGVRLSGMPAFGRIESDDRIWRIVQYLRTVKSPQATAQTQR